MKLKIVLYNLAMHMLMLLSKLFSILKCEIGYNECIENLRKIYTPRKIHFDQLLPVQSNEVDCSFIVPIYNAHVYLKKCLDSLVNQKTVYTYEVILIDDGSSDDSGVIADVYDKNFEFVHTYHQKNAGISAARNRGIYCAKGKYLAFVDNDDFVAENYVQILMDRAKETNADVVKCGHFRWDAERNKVISSVCYEYGSYGDDIGKNILKLKGFIWEGISKRSLWNAFRFPEGYWYEDIITRFVILRSASKIEVLPDVLYYYSMHQTNASKTVWKHNNIKSLDELYLIAQILSLQITKNQRALSHALIYELSGVLWSRIRSLPTNIKKYSFNVAAHLLERYLIQDESYDNFEMKIIASFRNHSYFTWELLSCKKMLEVKMANDFGITQGQSDICAS